MRKCWSNNVFTCSPIFGIKVFSLREIFSQVTIRPFESKNVVRRLRFRITTLCHWMPNFLYSYCKFYNLFYVTSFYHEEIFIVCSFFYEMTFFSHYFLKRIGIFQASIKYLDLLFSFDLILNKSIFKRTLFLRIFKEKNIHNFSSKKGKRNHKNFFWIRTS